MSDIALRVEGLGKKYRIGESREAYKTLRDGLVKAAWKSFRQLERAVTGNGFNRDLAATEFWALRDISFEGKHGDVLAIIGENGAGKSTLLKILSRITEPTEGQARIHGRVGSLLEVGTGFHPELTGRENVYLNGAILGMPKADIDRKFDEIVAFAEVERFLDTPMKRYSSGMQLRLGFAVAAHLEPELLIVDEVLAVGDAAFQKKCLGKLENVSREGRTVLFVSHNMAAVRALCDRAIVLRKGHLVQDTRDVSHAVACYSGHGSGASSWVRDANDVTGHRLLVFTSIDCHLSGDQPCHRLTLDVKLESIHSHGPFFLAFDIVDASRIPIMQALPNSDTPLEYSAAGHRFTIEIELPPMVPGQYRISAWAGPHYNQSFDRLGPVLEFSITNSPIPGRTYPHSVLAGHLVAPSRLRTPVVTTT